MRFFMSTVIFFIALLVTTVVSISTLALDGPPQPVDPVAGQWELHSRSCSSGVPARDNFVIGRDRITLSFFNGKYDGQTIIGPCHIWVSGKYETKDHMLRVFDVTGASNCQPQPIFSPVTEFFNISEGQLEIYMGPSRGYMDPCPQGDMLESEFTHIGQ